MKNNIVVASLAALGLLSSTLALAEVTDGSTSAIPNKLEAPVVIAQTLATPATVEPETEISAASAASEAPADPMDQPRTNQTLAQLVHEADLDEADDSEAKCLATAVYYEARSESLSGQLAVAHVVIARARSGRFPSSLCGVVTQPGQFSFVRSGRMPANGPNIGQWHTAQAIAQIALDNSWDNPVQGALYFHATRVSPSWGRERVTRIGGHVFYR